MKKSHYMWAALFSVAAMIALAFAWKWSIGDGTVGRRPVSPESSVASNGEGEELRLAHVQAQVVGLQRELRRLKQSQDSLSVSTEPAPVTAGEHAEGAREDPIDPHELHLRQFDRLESRFGQETRDRDWSFDAEQQIGEVFASGRVPGTKPLAAACATTLCRVVVDHEDEASQKELGRAVARTEPFAYGVYYFYENKGDIIRTTMYVARTGHDLSSGTP